MSINISTPTLPVAGSMPGIVMERVHDFPLQRTRPGYRIPGVYTVILLLIRSCHKPPTTSFPTIETSNTIGYSRLIVYLTVVYTYGKILICLCLCLI